MTFERQSPVATIVVPSLGYRRGKYARREHVRCVTPHTTGGGVVTRWKRQGARFKEPTPFETALRVYARLMEAGPHYVVGQRGECAQTCPEELVAWHVGSKGAQVYRKLAAGGWAGAGERWWFARFESVGMRSPAELAFGRAWENGSHNGVSIGIEVVPPEDDVRGPWSEACWDTLAALIADVSSRWRFDPDIHSVATHSEIHPKARSARGAPWDPPTSQWFGWHELAARAGWNHRVPILPT